MILAMWKENLFELRWMERDWTTAKMSVGDVDVPQAGKPLSPAHQEPVRMKSRNDRLDAI